MAGKEGFALGLMKVSDDGEAALNGVTFGDGTIEFDVQLSGNDMPGIEFRRMSGEGEEFYLRPGQDCRASDDCVQYAPIIHGFMLWNAYPQYEGPAPVLDRGWNHVKLVLSGRRMRVYVNGSAAPVLDVPELAGESAAGGLVLRGPAIFAHLLLRPGEVEGLPRTALPDTAVADGRYLRRWSVSPLSVFHAGVAPMYDEMPAAGAGWKEVTAERGGFVNLNRVFAVAPKAPRQMVWLKTTVEATADGSKRVEMGGLGRHRCL